MKPTGGVASTSNFANLKAAGAGELATCADTEVGSQLSVASRSDTANVKNLIDLSSEGGKERQGECAPINTGRHHSPQRSLRASATSS